MHELKLTIKAHIILKPSPGKCDFVADYRRLAERDGTYLGERDLGSSVVIYSTEFAREADTITYVARGLAASL